MPTRSLIIVLCCLGVPPDVVLPKAVVPDAFVVLYAPAQNGSGSSSRSPASSSTRPAPKKPVTPPSLLWPTTGRRIVEGYGERTNPRTGTVTVNPGINIASVRGTVVTAAAAGTVSRVSWLPGYGTVVIVTHRDRYRTVYGNLSGALVKRGAKVTAGARIGTVSGTSVHFEVWCGSTRLNPLTLLSK